MRDKRSKDPIVEQVVEKMRERSEVGLIKYGRTLQDNNDDDFLVHLQQELMDASLYAQKQMVDAKRLDNIIRGMSVGDEVLFDHDAVQELLDMYDEHNLAYERYCRGGGPCSWSNFQNSLQWAGKVYCFIADYQDKKKEQRALLEEIMREDQKSGLYE